VRDGKPGKDSFDALWNPIFSPDGKKILVRAIEKGIYFRKVVSVDQI